MTKKAYKQKHFSLSQVRVPMLKAGKLHIIASCAAILAILSITSKGGQKYGGFLFNCTKNPLIVLCWKSQQSTMWVYFKIESVLQAKRKKIKFFQYLVDQDMVAATADSQ